MPALLLLRHGQIKANRVGRWHGSTDSPLTWKGRRQAHRTGIHLATNESLGAIYTSPLKRCVATASSIAKHTSLEPVVVEDLREYAIGDWEDITFKRLADDHDFVNAATADVHFAPPGGESLNAVAERMVAAVQSINDRHDPDERVLIVGHGAALAVALGAFLDGDSRRWTNYHFANCSLTELMLSPRAYVNVFNSTEHLL